MYQKCPYCHRKIKIDREKRFIPHSIWADISVTCEASGKTKKEYRNKIFKEAISDLFIEL